MRFAFCFPNTAGYCEPEQEHDDTDMVSSALDTQYHA